MPDGRDLYELTKGSVLPGYRNKRLLSRLVQEGIDEVRNNYPDCPIVTATANEKAIGMYQRLRWKEATWGDGSELDILVSGGKPDGKDKRWLKEYEKMIDKGYKIFLFDPKGIG